MLKLKPSMLFGALALPCSFLASAGGLTDSGKISLLSHEISGSYVQILDDQQAIIQSNPDSCADSNMYFLPIDHANYQVLSSSLLTAEMTQRELAFHVEGCENNMAKIAFVRFGNWQGVVLNSPTEPNSSAPTDTSDVRVQRFTTVGSTDAVASFTVPQGTNLVYVTMCGGGGAGGIRSNAQGGAGSTAIVKSPYLVSPGETIEVNIGGGGSADYNCSPRCGTGGDSKFGRLVAPGATNARRTDPSYIPQPVLPPNFSADSSLLVEGGHGGGSGVLNGEGVNGNSGGLGIVYERGGSNSPENFAGGGASLFGQGGNAEDGTSFDSFGRVSGGHATGYCSGGGVGWDFGGNGAPGTVIIEW